MKLRDLPIEPKEEQKGKYSTANITSAIVSWRLVAGISGKSASGFRFKFVFEFELGFGFPPLGDSNHPIGNILTGLARALHGSHLLAGILLLAH